MANSSSKLRIGQEIFSAPVGFADEATDNISAPRIGSFEHFKVGGLALREIHGDVSDRRFGTGVRMSKIPRGEWSAIAARYAKGESITRIAQSYGCTPPAIHYILKRTRQRATHNLEQPLNGRSETPQALTPQLAQTLAASDIPHAIDPRHEARDATRSAADKSTPSAAAPSTLRVVIDRRAATVTPTLRDLNHLAVLQVQPGRARDTGGGSALTARLDRELRGRAEAAIEVFRSSSNAALTEDSLVVRQRLRQAASDLMRVAARTIIVLIE